VTSGRIALGLFAFALITRLPFATTNLYAPDSVLYARGMERFDPSDQRPQPPGYLWYVLLLRGIDLVTQDPNRRSRSSISSRRAFTTSGPAVSPRSSRSPR